MRRAYEPPAIIELGSLVELTRQKYNKIGQATDMYSTQQNQLTGSLIPVP